MLKAYPSRLITPELRSFIRDHRDEMIAALAIPNLETTVGNILALPPHEVEALRAEIEATSEDDPNIQFDRVAFEKALPLIEKRRQSTDVKEHAA